MSVANPQDEAQGSASQSLLVYIVLIFLSLSFNNLTFAGEILYSEVNDLDDHFIVHLEMRIDADYDSVYNTLIDFENINELNDSIKESELLESDGDVHIVRLRSEGCVLFFCENITEVITVTELGRGYIKTIIDPDISDLSYGKALWQIIDEGEETKVVYKSDIVPKFWIPPLIGTYIFKNRLVVEGEKTINGIERIINSEYE